MEKNTDYFDGRSDAEKMQNVANTIHDIVNKKPEKNLKVQEAQKDAPEPEEIDPVVDLVGKAISTYKPKGHFFQGVVRDGNPKL